MEEVEKHLSIRYSPSEPERLQAWYDDEQRLLALHQLGTHDVVLGGRKSVKFLEVPLFLTVLENSFHHVLFLGVGLVRCETYVAPAILSQSHQLRCL